MEIFDLAITYIWEYDEDFVNKIEEVCQFCGLSTYVISYHNLVEVKNKIRSKKLHFNFLIDRASDVEDDFLELGNILMKRKTRIFNPYKKVNHAIDKASMHLEFITAGINVPFSIIIPPHNDEHDLLISLSDLAVLGRPFIIKPCNTTGGGIGVVTGAESLHEVLMERKTNCEDKYLLQEKIYPKYLDGKRAWFRCFYAFGKIIPVWWDDQTHLYHEFTGDDKTIFNLEALFTTVTKIQELIDLDFFSTEIVLTTSGKFIAIDYVNDQCDMRFQSKHYDGVPDNVVNQIVLSLKDELLRLKKNIKEI
jgi:hypothetical protein